MKAVLVAILFSVVACGPNWAEDCKNCTTDQPGPTIEAGPVVTTVVIDNDVTVNVNVDTTVQVQEDDDPSCNTCGTVDAGTPPPTVDAGTPHDAGSPDAGKPGCDCKKVCKEYKRVHSGHSKKTCHDKTKDKLVCVKTVLECRSK